MTATPQIENKSDVAASGYVGATIVHCNNLVRIPYCRLLAVRRSAEAGMRRIHFEAARLCLQLIIDTLLRRSYSLQAVPAAKPAATLGLAAGARLAPPPCTLRNTHMRIRGSRRSHIQR